MRKIQNLIDHITDVKQRVASIAEDVLKQNEQEIIDLVRYDQLYELGEDGRGIKLKPYAARTVRYKKRVGQPYNRTTLEDSGDFYKGFQVEYLGYGLRVFSRDAKGPYLAETYGSSIFAISAQNQQYLISTLVRPEVAKALLNG